MVVGGQWVVAVMGAVATTPGHQLLLAPRRAPQGIMLLQQRRGQPRAAASGTLGMADYVSLINFK